MRPLRGLVALAALLPALPTARAERKFYASAVSYCTASDVEPAIDVSRFLLEYLPDRGTAGFISFDISAASVEANLNPILNFELIAYGINAVNTSINLCDLLGGVLCPLPQYDFVGSATIPLPSIVAGKVDIPGIGYVIPDLEATAYVRLLRVEDNSEAACLRVDLSNGKTTRWASASWALGGLAIGCVLLSTLWFLVGTLVWPSVTLAPSSLASSASSISPALWASLGRRKERLFLLMSLLQFVATTGLLSLQYPIIYQAFTANFDWSLGLIRINPVQTAIDDLRNGTGGNLTQLAGRSNLVGGTRALKSVFARSMIPQALPGAEEVAMALLTEMGKSFSGASAPPSSSLSSRALSAISYIPSTIARRQALEAPVTTPDQAVAIPDVQETNTVNAVDYGIPVALVNLDISPYNAFTTVFINFLLLCTIVLGLIIVGGAVWALLRWLTGRKENGRLRRLGLSKSGAREEDEKRAGLMGGLKAFRRRRSGPFMTAVRAGTLRLLIISWYPLLVFTFFQWTLGSADSYAPIVLSVFTIVCVAAALLFLALRFFLIGRRAFHHPSSAAEDGAPFPDATEHLASPFRPTPVHAPITPNPTPEKALLKAERRQVEILTTGQMLAAGGAPYSPFWNAYKTRSRRTTAKKRNWWKGRGWWFGLVELLAMPFVLALFVAFAKESGWTQSVALVVLESLLFLSLCIWTPYEDKSSNFTHIFWQLFRVIIAGALITFNESIDLNEIARVAIGAVLAVISAVLVVLFFFLLVADFIQLCIFLVRGIKARRRQRQAVDNPVASPPPMAQTRDLSPTGLGLDTTGNGYAAPNSTFRESFHDSTVPGRSSLTLNSSGPTPVAKAV
ncbi:hypothetical protein JCM6882_001536 [Rhodosporidiobolus microsporus]